MFGHEDTDAYGIGWWADEANSDVKRVTGSYPAIHGWDFGNIDRVFNIDTVDFEQMKAWIKATYKRGGINTISWHITNVASGGDSWDKTPSVAAILPGGSHHDAYLKKLNLVADFLLDLKVGSCYMPIVFRPWHEHNGDWFWWGKGNGSEADFVSLWRFTVDYLKDTRNIHHLIYAFSPDRSRLDIDSAAVASYLYAYPGGEYVDVIGLDNYWDVGSKHNKLAPSVQNEHFVKSLALITAIARDKNKVAAVTETGSAGINNPAWFTEMVLDPILANRADIRLAWMLVWRNRDQEGAMAPYPNHPSAADFNVFKQNPYTFFEDDLVNVYKSKKPLK